MAVVPFRAQLLMGMFGAGEPSVSPALILEETLLLAHWVGARKLFAEWHAKIPVINPKLMKRMVAAGKESLDARLFINIFIFSPGAHASCRRRR